MVERELGKGKRASRCPRGLRPCMMSREALGCSGLSGSADPEHTLEVRDGPADVEHTFASIEGSPSVAIAFAGYEYLGLDLAESVEDTLPSKVRAAGRPCRPQAGGRKHGNDGF